MTATSADDSHDLVLLPVTVVEPEPASPACATQPAATAARTATGTIEISIRGAMVRLRGTVDEVSLSTVLRALAGNA